ncbi:PF20097 family protein [Planctomycetota bacterium]
MENQIYCPKCNLLMQQGYILDAMYGNAVNTTSKWSKGKPKKLLSFALPSAEINSMEITTYRCPKCGYLESYAL